MGFSRQEWRAEFRAPFFLRLQDQATRPPATTSKLESVIQ
jgi:hypothetical protein